MPTPGMTTRRLMAAVAGAAVILVALRAFAAWHYSLLYSHPYYFANRAAVQRRLERHFRKEAASERTALKRAEWTRMADECARTAEEAMVDSRKSYRASELPEFLRRDLRPEDLVD